MNHRILEEKLRRQHRSLLTTNTIHGAGLAHKHSLALNPRFFQLRALLQFFTAEEREKSIFVLHIPFNHAPLKNYTRRLH